MTRLALLLLLLLLLTVLAPPAFATSADAAFDRSQVLALPAGAPLAAALASDGTAAVAGRLPGSPVQQRIELAVRSGHGRPWRIAGFATSALAVRDLQVVIARAGRVLAWADIRRRSQAVVLATADAAGRLTVRERLPVANGFSAFPRLAVLRSGAVVLAWRDGRTSARARVRVATFDGERFAAAPRTAGTNAAYVVLAARAAGATVGWISARRSVPRKTRFSVRRTLPRALTVRSLDARGEPAGAATVAGRDVGATARLAGAPDGRLVASWLRPQKIRPYPGEDSGDAPPPSAYVRPVAFTRQLEPQRLAARPLASGRLPVGVPTVAFGGAGRAAATVRSSAFDPVVGPAFDALLAGSTAGGPWSAPQVVAHLGFSTYDPVVAARPSGPVVVASVVIPNSVPPPRWAVTASTAAGSQILGTTSASDGRGIAVARSGSGVLVAWPSSGGGVGVAEQR